MAKRRQGKPANRTVKVDQTAEDSVAPEQNDTVAGAAEADTVAGAAEADTVAGAAEVKATPDADEAKVDGAETAEDTTPAQHNDTVEGASEVEATPDADDVKAEEAVEPAADAPAEEASLGDDTAPEADLPDDSAEPASSEAEDTLAADTTPEPEPTPEPAPTVVQEKVIERKGGFVPMLLGGVVAAAVGFGASQYGFMAGGDDTFEADTSAALSDQSAQLTALSDRIDAAQAAAEGIDLSGLETSVATITDQLSGFDATLTDMGDQLAAMDSRMTALEKQPLAEAVSPEAIAAYERELEDLRTAIAAQREAVAQQQAEMEAMAEQALAAQANAQDQASLAASRSALADLTARMQAGKAYAEPLGTLTANGVSVPAAISDYAGEGIPSLTALATDFPDVARAALRASRDALPAAEGDGGLGSFLQKQLGARSTTPREGDDPDAVLSRAEAAVKSGDLDAALTELAALPPEGQAELADWTARAEARRDALAAAATLATELNQQ
ncbi:hypothetical protein TRN7648_02503 [Tropicibacter naphthalenivorans]|uniref:Mitochondrial inner membrane protein n=1 Tax=Tropicibacter naphthalenivorans TaxID=441103 RepID=A0A0P1GDS7_9RHOB|nr:hypothetical protein [Tropicibacter naphthalenivorans]CUH79496.1 hypothetical protein TRN7648_02503 [Tropicibacter naphthalenivorans]